MDFLRPNKPLDGAAATCQRQLRNSTLRSTIPHSLDTGGRTRRTGRTGRAQAQPLRSAPQDSRRMNSVPYAASLR